MTLTQTMAKRKEQYCPRYERLVRAMVSHTHMLLVGVMIALTSGVVAADDRIEDASPLVLTLTEIRVLPTAMAHQAKSDFVLRVSNKDDIGYCLVPSASELAYSLDAKQHSPRGGGTGKRPIGRSALSADQLRVPPVIIPPHSVTRIDVRVPWAFVPRRACSIAITYQPSPHLRETHYRGIPIYRNALKTSCNVAPTRDNDTGLWVFRPVPSKGKSFPVPPKNLNEATEP